MRRCATFSLATLALLLAGCNAAAPTTGTASAPRAVAASTTIYQPLTAKFSVLVRGADRRKEPVAVEEPGALPVHDGGAMYLEVQLSEPAFVYLVWLDCQGRLSPLYPWNNESLTVTDINETPPKRRATDRVFSPMLGRDWPFSSGEGLETVFLLASRTALPHTVKLGDFFHDLPAGKLREPGELVVLSLDDDKQTVTTLASKHRGDDIAAESSDDSLKQCLRTLCQHFEIVQAVRFAHAPAADAASKP
jgi:hypothetical protein